MGIIDGLEALDKSTEEEVAAHDPSRFRTLPKSVQHWMNAWPSQASYTDTLRASQVHDVCPREFVLNYWQPTFNKSFDWVSRIRMATGTFLHDYVQNRVLGPMGVLYGNWDRVIDGMVHETVRGFHPDPDKTLYEIQHQKTLTWLYTEDQVWDEGWRIGGHLDGYVCPLRVGWIEENARLFKEDPVKACKRLHSITPDESKLLQFELKTTAKYGFDKITGPKDIADYYKAQAVTYQKLAGSRSTVFWYIERDSMASKSFIYEFEEGWWTEVRRKSRIIWESIRDETLPEAMMKCKMPTDKRAKKCAHRDPCWLGRLDFAAFVLRGKRFAEESGRELLDLSSWVPPKD